MPRTIEEAYEIYRRITTEYQDLDRIAEIFTDDFVGGNASYGQIRGVEAQTIFLGVPREIGLPPEDHLSCMITGDDLAFRARVWGRERGAAPFVDAIGHLIFDSEQGRFCFYHGFYDSPTMNAMLAALSPEALEKALAGAGAVREATERWEARASGGSLPERLKVAESD